MYEEDESKNAERRLQEIRPNHYVFVTDEEAVRLKEQDQTHLQHN